jgi:ribosomal-protein-alanine N-acetyltransferase
MNSTLVTDRLILRPHTIDDIDAEFKLINNFKIANNTCLIPYPYTREDSVKWFEEQKKQSAAGVFAFFIITLKTTKELIGAISLNIDITTKAGCLGYWLGENYWGNGYATEAARTVVKYGFETLLLHTISAEIFSYNIASEKVLLKIAMNYVGEHKQFIAMREREELIKEYKILKEACPP